jgi:hypothetical protein
MRRIGIVAAITVAFIVALSQAVANAGGAVWDFEREYYAAGETVSGRVTFNRAAGPPIRAEAGPFTAYILPEGQGIDAPRIPPTAIPVGPMHLSRTEYGDWLARVDFTLPDLPTGVWMLEFCNDPCTVSAMGELTFGWFRVVPSRDVAPVYAARDRLKQRVHSLIDNARRSDRRAEALAGDVRELRKENLFLERRVNELARVRRPTEPPAEFPAPLGWALVAFTVLFGLVAFRPRRARPATMDPPSIERIDDPEREIAIRR